jgi:hypothetical protein
VLVAVDHGLDPVTQPQLVQDVAEMGLDGTRCHHELVGYLSVGPAADHQVEDLSLAAGKAAQLGGWGQRRRAPGGELGQQPPGHRWGEQRAAVRGGAHPEQQFLRGGVLEQEPAGPGAQRGVNVLVQVIRGQDDHPDLVPAGRASRPVQDAAGGRQPVEHWHPHVHQHDVRLERTGQRHGLLAVARLVMADS